MIPPEDPFARDFDAIDVDPARAPAREAIESAMASLAPAVTAELPQAGFSLLNDAGGRFTVDTETGIVTLADDALLQRERNTVHGVKLRVVEPSGAAYELDMRLRITGRVPQMVGAEDFAAIAGLTDETVLTAVRVPTLIMPTEATTPIVVNAIPLEAAPAPVAWTRFAAAQGHCVRTPRTQPRRGFIVSELPAANLSASLAFDGPPAPFPSHLPWSL